MPLSRDDIAIDVYDHDGKLSPDRGVLCGRTGSGKSTFASVLLNMYWQDFVQSEREPQARMMICDTKPRWRHEHYAHRFAKQSSLTNDPEKMIKHSILARNNAEYKAAKRRGGVILLQNKDLPTDQVVKWQVECMQDFFNTQREDTPSLLYIDEGMDFFGPTGNGKYGDIVQRCFRAGRELGMATFIGVQRPKQINLQVLTESSYLALFALRYREDVERLYEMGYPVGMSAPTRARHFALWRDEDLISNDTMLKFS